MSEAEKAILSIQVADAAYVAREMPTTAKEAWGKMCAELGLPHVPRKYWAAIIHQWWWDDLMEKIRSLGGFYIGNPPGELAHLRCVKAANGAIVDLDSRRCTWGEEALEFCRANQQGSVPCN